ncbi:MAG: ABC transporter permease [Pseudobutyrivibrio sp.]|nr:ABC transporter permease [Pseudobutyrivibrio sp.]
MNKTMKAYLKLESLLFFREPLQVVFSFFFPAVMFSIFASVFSGNLEGSEEYFNAYIPGYFTTIIFIVSMFMVGYQMVADKEDGVYKRLKVTPFDFHDIYRAMFVKTMIICGVAGTEIILLAKFVFGATLTTHWVQFIVAFIFGSILAVVAGFTVFALTTNTKQALTVIILSFYPLVMLGDNTFPLEMMPKTIQVIAPIINPLYHLNRVLRGAWVGEMFNEVVSILYVAAFIVILGLISYHYDKVLDKN